MGVLTARDLDRVSHGTWVRVAGHVIVRQRPGTAKGFCFLTLEDETGTADAVVTGERYERWRVVLNTSPLVAVAGRLERVDGVTHVRAAAAPRGAGSDAAGTRLLVRRAAIGPGWTPEFPTPEIDDAGTQRP